MASFKFSTLVAAFALASSLGTAQAATYTEDFEGTFPAWESGWFGTMSNARNVYCGGALNCSDRGNNPDGLWIVSPAGESSTPVSISFTPGFGATLTSFSFDVASYGARTLTAWDSVGNTIYTANVASGGNALADPGSYTTYSFSSTTGIGGFAFSGNAAGNLSIDNLNVVSNPVPEPETYALMLGGLLAVGAVARRRNPRG